MAFSIFSFFVPGGKSFAATTFDYNDGLLDDPTLTLSYNANANSSLTDNNLASGLTYVPYNYQDITLSKPITANEFYIKHGTTSNLWFELYNGSTQVYIDTSVSVEGYYPLPSNITFDKIRFEGNNGNVSVNEIELFNDPTRTFVPSDITGLQSNVTDTSVNFTWSLPSTLSDFDHVNVYQNGSLVDSLPNGATGVSYNNLTSGTIYNYLFKGANPDNSKESAGVSASITTMVDSSTVPPANPTNFTGVASDSSVSLTWDDNTDSDFDHYMLYRDSVAIKTLTATTFSDTSLSSETSYSYKLTAVDLDGNESSGSVISVSTLAQADTVAPAAPSNFSGSGGNGYATYSWDKNTESDLAGYDLYVGSVKQNTNLITSTSFTVDGLDNDQTFNAYVVAVDASGNVSALSAIVPITTTSEGIPLLHLKYSLQDVSNGISSMFGSYWLIIAFAVSIPLSFLIGSRIKGLFLS